MNGTWLGLGFCPGYPGLVLTPASQRYGKGAQRMLGHDWLIECGAGFLSNPGFLAVARFQNVTDVYTYMTLGRTKSLYQALADYGTEMERWSGRFLQGAHFFCLPRDDWWKMRQAVTLDSDNNLKEMTYYLFDNYWSPMAWAIRTQNPESPTQLTACQANLCENQNMAYTGEDLDNPEVTPIKSSETEEAIELLKRSKVVRFLDQDEYRSIRFNVKGDNGMNENWFHVGKILKGIGAAMNAASPIKALGIKYLLQKLGVDTEAANAAANNIYGAVASGLSSL